MGIGGFGTGDAKMNMTPSIHMNIQLWCPTQTFPSAIAFRYLLDLTELLGGYADELQNIAFYTGENVLPCMAWNRKSNLTTRKDNVGTFPLEPPFYSCATIDSASGSGWLCV
jgi:hypothetical protein